MHKALSRQVRRALKLADDAQVGSFISSVELLAKLGTIPEEVASKLLGLTELLAGIDATY